MTLPIDRRLLALALAISLSIPLVPMGMDSAEAQGESCTEMRYAPLWIRNVTFFEHAVDVEDDDNTYINTENGSVFAESGTDLRFDVKIENRFGGDDCAQPSPASIDNLDMKIQYLHGGQTETELEDLSCQNTAGADRIEAGQVCTQEFRLPRSANEQVQGPAGEQRIRLTVFSEAADDNGDGEPEDCSTDDRPLAENPGACAGAERIIVVDELPDLALQNIQWATPQEDRRTTYESDFSAFDLTIRNNGDYPNWNPNARPPDGLYYGRSAYDGDGDGVPEDYAEGNNRVEREYDYTSDSGPVCRWLGSLDETTNGNEDGSEYRCSYRRGEIMETPIYNQTRRSENRPVIDSGWTEIYTDRGDQNNDKIDALGTSDTRVQEIIAVDRYKKAGEFLLEAEVAPNTTYVPEEDEDNNEDDFTLDILGVDLKITDPRVVVRTPDGTGSSCPQSNPCPIDSTIELDPRYANEGDSEVDDDSTLTDRTWRTGIYLNNELEFSTEEPDVPTTDEDPRRFFSFERQIEPEQGGGNHTIIIRLDHPDNYQNDPDYSVSDPQGVVGERVEMRHHPGENQELDNTYRITLWFEDLNPPDIQQTQILTDESEDGVPQVPEGENVTFQATIEDTSLVNVTALFEHPNGTPANFTGPDGKNFSQLAMTQTTDEEIWNVTTNMTGDLGRYVFTVRAEDLNHTRTSTGTEFDLTKRSVTIDVNELLVNGAESPSGPNAPRYEGNVTDPENWVNMTASINGSGFPESSVENKDLKIFRPNGTLAASLEINTTRKCIVNNTLTEETDTRRGSECNVDDPEEVEEEWTLFWGDTRYPTRDLDPVDLDWAGQFNVTWDVEDKFERNSTLNRITEIRDRLNDNGEEEPILEDTTITPTAVDPGGTIEANGSAFDVLRVEGVFLNLTKPSGAEVQAPLNIDDLDDQTTRNGTYAGTFDAGAGAEYFDQGGTYEVQVAAEDFAGNVNASDVVSLAVNDTDEPEIVRFETLPSEAQEVGGTIRWFASIDDQTAIQPPVLRVNRPTSGSTGPIEMRYNASQDRWKAGPLNATEVDVGTWTYDLTVEDYTGKQVTASGQIRVEENLPPQDQRWRPNVLGPGGGSYGPPQPMVGVQIVDFGQGVNRSSIQFAVNGENLTDDAQITAIPDVCDSCYQLNYTPPEPFEAGSTVDAVIQAQDVSDPPQVSGELRHQFTVDAEGPTSDVQMGPAITRGDRRVVGLETSINVSATDGGSGPSLIHATVSDDSPNGSSQTIDVAGADGSFRLQDFGEVVDGHGVYQLSVQARDAVGNTGPQIQRTVLFDQLGPSIEVFAEPGKPRELVFANVTDDSRVQEVLARYSVDGGPEQVLLLEEENGTWSVRLFNQRTDQAFQEGATVRFTVEATDIFGNVRSSPQRNFTAGDSPPEIAFTSPEEGATISGRADLTWDASDAETAAENLRISLFYKKPGGTFQEIPNAQDQPNRGSYTLDTTVLPNGELTLQVFVLDGQNFAADEVNVTVRNLPEMFSAPELEGAQTENGTPVLVPGQDTVFRVQIDGNVQRAYANITRGETVVQTVQLQNEAGSTWRGSFSAPSERGNYSMSLTAVTSEGTQEAPSAYGFSVQGSPTGVDNFIPEWTLLTALTATAVALGVLGLRNRWT